jgi:hypothetical protein
MTGVCNNHDNLCICTGRHTPYVFWPKISDREKEDCVDVYVSLCYFVGEYSVYLIVLFLRTVFLCAKQQDGTLDTVYIEVWVML